MKRSMLCVLMVAVVASFSMVCLAPAQGDGEGPKLMTQGELAQLLVKKLGLYRGLPANPSDLDCFMILSQNGIYPSPTLKVTEQNPTPGWNLGAEAEATLADLAVLLVRSLGLEEQVVGDMADPQNWLNVLKTYEVPYDSIGAGVAQLTPFNKVPVALPLFQITGDPLDRRKIPVSEVEDVFGVIAFPDIGPVQTAETGETGEEGPPPTPVTQN